VVFNHLLKLHLAMEITVFTFNILTLLYSTSIGILAAAQLDPS
jgi:hypothetical protein